MTDEVCILEGHGHDVNKLHWQRKPDLERDWSFGQQPARTALGTNPKDLLGAAKVSITKLPAIATVQGAMAMMDGAGKYGPYNWRKNKVIASIYVDAAYRHLMAWFEGQECAGDSSVSHFGDTLSRV